MRGRSVVVDDHHEMEDTVADLISRGYWLMNQGTRRATLVRPRTGRFLGVLGGLCALFGLVLVAVASTGEGDGSAGIAGIVFVLVVMPVTVLLRSLYVHIRRDQVRHVIVRDR